MASRRPALLVIKPLKIHFEPWRREACSSCPEGRSRIPDGRGRGFPGRGVVLFSAPYRPGISRFISGSDWLAAMMQELADKVWGNPGFHDAAHRIEIAWLTKEIRGIVDGHADIADATRLMRSAAILACSETADHRRSAFRVATCAYDLFWGTGQVPLDQALRVVLTRLGNFPFYRHPRGRGLRAGKSTAHACGK